MQAVIEALGTIAMVVGCYMLARAVVNGRKR